MNFQEGRTIHPGKLFRSVHFQRLSDNHLPQVDMASPHHHHHDYYESIGSARSPGGIQHQQSHPSLHRAQSRHFETFTAGGLYTAEDHAARYDTNRFESRLVSNYPYEASGAQTWNPGNFNAATMVGLGSATGRIKTPSRHRAALPSVCYFCSVLLLF